MTEDDVRKNAFRMSLTSPAYRRGLYRFVDREFMIVSYRTDPDVLAAVIPAPLEMTVPSRNSSSSGCPIRRVSATIRKPGR
jgi:acetoacetate decarboxylase